MATTPGLLVSEEPSSPIINFGYRGLDSQRSEFMQVLKDGVSIKNEQFGFPETHYTPILDAVERIEFIRAGAALQFGPQPGGAMNFVMKMPRRDTQFHFMTKNAVRHRMSSSRITRRSTARSVSSAITPTTIIASGRAFGRTAITISMPEARSWFTM